MNRPESDEDRAKTLLAEQNFPAAVVAGLIAAALAGIAYGIVVYKWPFSYGFAAAGVGMFVGFWMQFLGRGIDLKFGVAAGVFTVGGILLGKLTLAVIHLAPARVSSMFDVFTNDKLTWAYMEQYLTISLIELVYWFVAVFAAVFLSKRALSR